MAPASDERAARRWASFVSPAAGTTAVIVALAYVIFVLHYAINAPLSDEWTSVLPLAHKAVHHQVGWHDLWTQYFNEGRTVLANVAFALAAAWTHLNIRALIGAAAVVHGVAFVVLLALYQRFTNRRLTVIPVLVLAVIWFSFSGVENALWGYQIQLYLTLLCFLLTTLALDIATRDDAIRRIAVACAVAAAVATTLSTFQGLLVWPVGALVVATNTRGARRWRLLALWSVAAVITIAVYYVGYNSKLGYSGCLGNVQSQCTTHYAFTHSTKVPPYFFALLGNAWPTTQTGLFLRSINHVGRHELLGAAFLAIAAFVVVEAYRHRPASPERTIPVALIAFALLWDAAITIGRVAGGPRLALQGHFSTPQLLLVAGIAFWMLDRAGSRAVDADDRATNRLPAWACRGAPIVVLAAIVLMTSVSSATTGLRNARFYRKVQFAEAQFLANYDKVPLALRPCYLQILVNKGLTSEAAAYASLRQPVAWLQSDRLTVYAPGAAASLRALGPPKLATCYARR